jgi:hypothetical protein
MTKEEEIKIVHGGKSHIVILGAGASFASTLSVPEKAGKQLPLMKNLIEVCGLTNIIQTLPKNLRDLKDNFENFYSELFEMEQFKEERLKIEKTIYKYFEEMDLPETPTIYDYLILSLRHHKDLIASFNWDPFLYKAYLRNNEFVKSPGIVFLHGNVSIGFDKSDGSSGPAGWYSKRTSMEFEPTKILFPVNKKDYNSDAYIKGQWDSLGRNLKDAECVTIFGYSAPKTDIEAITLLQNAWGNVDERNMEQFEFIDTQPEEQLLESWKTFVHSHHYFYVNDYFKSSLANHPRRTVESYHHWAMPMNINEAFQDGNKVPNDFKTLEELWNWHAPLIEAENAFYEKKS